MTAQPKQDPRPISRGQRNLLAASAVMTFLLITMGGIVCVTGSGRGCPDWPGCFGNVIPPPQVDSLIEYLHRLIAALTTPVILVAAVVSWRRSRSVQWVSRPVLLALFFVLTVIVYGAFAIVTGIPPWLAAIDLGSALVVLALLLTATVVAFSRRTDPAAPDRLTFSSPFSKLALWAAGGAFLVLMSSVLVVASGSISRCLGWPVYGEPLALEGMQGWMGMTRRLVALATSLLIITILAQAWRTQRGRPAVLRSVVILGALFIVETVIGILLAAIGQTVWLRAIYVATTAAFWSSLVILVVVAGLAESEAKEERLEMQPTGSPAL